jgi:hypothetical protein
MLLLCPSMLLSLLPLLLLLLLPLLLLLLLPLLLSLCVPQAQLLHCLSSSRLRPAIAAEATAAVRDAAHPTSSKSTLHNSSSSSSQWCLLQEPLWVVLVHEPCCSPLLHTPTAALPSVAVTRRQ